MNCADFWLSGGVQLRQGGNFN
jgi:hypothetical protein